MKKGLGMSLLLEGSSIDDEACYRLFRGHKKQTKARRKKGLLRSSKRSVGRSFRQKK